MVALERGEVPMRAISIALLAVVTTLATSVEPSQAQNRRFCSQRPIGSSAPSNCAYDTMEQCRASASGTGAYCTSNSFYVEPEKPVKGKKKRERESAPRS
jgi:Protein of unknown function (DUF3551)